MTDWTELRPHVFKKLSRMMRSDPEYLLRRPGAAPVGSDLYLIRIVGRDGQDLDVFERAHAPQDWRIPRRQRPSFAKYDGDPLEAALIDYDLYEPTNGRATMHIDRWTCAPPPCVTLQRNVMQWTVGLVEYEIATR